MNTYLLHISFKAALGRLTLLKLAACMGILAGLSACGGGGGGGTSAPAIDGALPTPPTAVASSGFGSSANLATATTASMPTMPTTATVTTTPATTTPATTTTATVTATATSAPLTYTAASVAQQCVVPRTGAGFMDKQGNIDTEKLWVRAHMDETYLFYKDVPVVDPARFTAAAFGGSVFNALRIYFNNLVTPKITASGKDVDQFSFATPTQNRVNQQAGISSGYGINFARLNDPNNTASLVIRVLFVEPNSPGDLAGVRRGDTVKSVDGVDINDTTPAGQAVLNAGLNPSTAVKTTTFGLQAADADQPCDVTVVSSTTVAVTPVQNAKTFKVGTSTVGYFALNSFSAVIAQPQLIDTIRRFKTAGVNELVLDLRYNGGGILLLASQLSYMLGDASLSGKVFETSVCNDKNPFDICKDPGTFVDGTLGDVANNVTPGQALPQLGLKRVFVLTTESTCSASESVINGLSPYLQVVRIGSTTCGKPYGFFVTDNCGTSYAALQFKLTNAQGFSNYEDGFAPTCVVPDDLSRQRGDKAELMLSGAVNYIKTGSCPAASQGEQKINGLGTASYTMMRSPMEEMRIINPTKGSLR